MVQDIFNRQQGRDMGTQFVSLRCGSKPISFKVQSAALIAHWSHRCGSKPISFKVQ